jgi:hypothetical protein
LIIPDDEKGVCFMKVYVYTDYGWKNTDHVLTPELWKIKNNSSYKPVKPYEELTEKFRIEMPFVVVRKDYYIIQSVH